MSEGFNWVSLKLVREKKVEYLPTACTTDKAAEILKPMLENCDREKYIILMLDNKLHVVAANTVSIGTVNVTLAHPREVFKVALLCNASSIILAHNHPSGDPTPSQEDLESTKRLDEAGKLLGVKVIDHIIIGDKTWISFKAKGLI